MCCVVTTCCAAGTQITGSSNIRRRAQPMGLLWLFVFAGFLHLRHARMLLDALWWPAYVQRTTIATTQLMAIGAVVAVVVVFA